MSSFHESSGGLRFVELVTLLSLSRDSLRSSLLSLTEMGLVQKNPGYGHPLRQEYVVTKNGINVAKMCQHYLYITGRDPLFLRKWPAPLLLSLHQGNHKFNELCNALTITPRALTQSLRLLESTGYVIRAVKAEYPPTTTYRLSKTGIKMTRSIDLLLISL